MTTPVLAHLQDDLASAAERAAAVAATPAWRRRRVRLGTLGAVAVLGVTGGATAATDLWSPTIGDDRNPGQLSRSAPPQAQLDALAVLRRPQTDADRGAESAYTLRFLNGHGPVRVGYVRLLGTESDGRSGYVLAPVEGTPPPDPRVVAALRRLQRSGRRSIPGAEFEDAMRAGGGRRLSATEEMAALRAAGGGPHESTRDQLCLWARDPVDGGGLSCFSLAAVRAGRAVMGIGRPVPSAARRRAAGRRPRSGGRDPNTGLGSVPVGAIAMTEFGIVPDGVATVRHGDGPDAPTADVHDNFWQLALPSARGLGQLRYLDADGREVLHRPGRR